jgi:hypothetical protein
MFVVECQARDLLAETGIDDKAVLDTFERMVEREDAPDALIEVNRQSARLAESVGLTETTSTVLLASLLRVRGALACRVLERAGVNVPGLRAKVIGQVTLDQDRGLTGQRAAVRPPEPRQIEPRPLDGRATEPRTGDHRLGPQGIPTGQMPRVEPGPKLPVRAQPPGNNPVPLPALGGQGQGHAAPHQQGPTQQGSNQGTPNQTPVPHATPGTPLAVAPQSQQSSMKHAATPPPQRAVLATDSATAQAVFRLDSG